MPSGALPATLRVQSRLVVQTVRAGVGVGHDVGGELGEVDLPDRGLGVVGVAALPVASRARRVLGAAHVLGVSVLSARNKDSI